jgi:diguanylate cyclase (GGDEF)-like protein
LELNRWLSRVFPGSYRARLLAVVCCCTTLPVAVFATWLLLSPSADVEEVVNAAALAVAGTFLGLLLALVLLFQLLEPLRHAADALDAYDRERRLPDLRVSGRDDMARLLAGINRSLRGIDVDLQQLQHEAAVDGLTGAYNRRGCERALADSLTVSVNGRAPFVLFIVDLDNLKPINDGFGHAAGDRVLVSLVESARAHCLGRGDWIGRWGGDEFLIGVHDELERAKQRIRGWLERLASPAGDAPPVQVSAGCAHFLPGLDPRALYRQADRAMYRAKSEGGNRLVCHSALAADVRKAG